MAKAVDPKPQSKQNTDYIWAVGRRKRAIARVRLFTKKATKDEAVDILVNDKPIGAYFHNALVKTIFGLPLRLTKSLGKYSATVKVSGSGLDSQLDAVNHALSRALVKADAANRAILKPKGLLTRDPREKQKRMIGRGGKARAKKQSPKR